MERYSLEMHFAGSAPELHKTVFECPAFPCPIISKRGRNPDSEDKNSFQWSKAVRAMSVVFIGSHLHQTSATSCVTNRFVLSGEKGSLAASLDYAISKMPQWLNDMFGSDHEGVGTIRKLIWRTNPERKRSGPVSLFVPDGRLRDLKITMVQDGRILERSEIAALLALLNSDGKKLPPRQEVAGNLALAPQTLEIEQILQDRNHLLDFRKEWLAVVEPIIRETKKILNGMVFDTELGRWWKTVAGTSYLLANFKILQQRKRVRRLFVISDDHPEKRHEALSNAYLNRLLGADVRIMRLHEYNKISPFPNCMFSTHDEIFAGIHRVRDTTATTEIISEYARQKECRSFYDEVFKDPQLSASLEQHLVETTNGEVILQDAKKQHAWFLNQTKSKNVMALVKPKERWG